MAAPPHGMRIDGIGRPGIPLPGERPRSPLLQVRRARLGIAAPGPEHVGPAVHPRLGPPAACGLGPVGHAVRWITTLRTRPGRSTPRRIRRVGVALWRIPALSTRPGRGATSGVRQVGVAVR